MLGNVSLFSSSSPVNMTNYSTKFYIIVKVCLSVTGGGHSGSVVDSSLELILVQSQH